MTFCVLLNLVVLIFAKESLSYCCVGKGVLIVTVLIDRLICNVLIDNDPFTLFHNTIRYYAKEHVFIITTSLYLSCEQETETATVMQFFML